MLYRLIVAVFVLAMGTVAYFGVHYAGTVLADDPPAEEEGGKNAIERAAEADLAKPVQNGVVNGISIVPGNTPAAAPGAQSAASADAQTGAAAVRGFPGENPCTDDNPPKSAAVSTAGDLNFTYPAGWTLLDEWAIACGDTTMSLYREMEPANDPLADIVVMRWKRATGIELQAAADRVGAVTVSGKKAVHVEPVRTATGTAIGPDQLVVTEPWGLTTVVAWQTSGDSLSAVEVYKALSGAGSTTD